MTDEVLTDAEIGDAKRKGYACSSRCGPNAVECATRGCVMVPDPDAAQLRFARAVEAAVLAKYPSRVRVERPSSEPEEGKIYIGKDGMPMVAFGCEPSFCPKCGQEPRWVKYLEVMNGQDRLRLHCRCGHVVYTLCADYGPRVVGTP